MLLNQQDLVRPLSRHFDDFYYFSDVSDAKLFTNEVDY